MPRPRYVAWLLDGEGESPPMWCAGCHASRSLVLHCITTMLLPWTPWPVQGAAEAALFARLIARPIHHLAATHRGPTRRQPRASTRPQAIALDADGGARFAGLVAVSLAKRVVDGLAGRQGSGGSVRLLEGPSAASALPRR